MKVHISMRRSLEALLLVMICLSCNMARVWAMTQQLEPEVMQHQKRLNKPIKTIKSPDGDIIDCVHISHQPAFDHPLLKNHTIQMRPSFHPLGLYDENKVASKMEPSTVPQLWHQNGRCPKDTIPIRRTKKDDVLSANSVETYGKKRHRTLPNPTSAGPNRNGNGDDYEHALVFVMGDQYHGAKATINVWNPKLQEKDEYSSTQIWITGGPPEKLNTIEAGWHVCPSVNGDNNTRLFTYWTSDNYGSTGCYNLRCSGFIQVNKEIALGATIVPTSSYDGRQYEITLLVWKDPITRNWWLQYGNRSSLGYWPSSLFSFMTESASEMQWGGEVFNLHVNGQHTFTEMGSGHFPNEQFRRASYIRDIEIVDSSNKLQSPQKIQNAMSRSECYDIDKEPDGYFYYGGPGGKNPDCI